MILSTAGAHTNKERKKTMANYESVTRTNYFRVTDEKRYEELYNRLRGYADQIYPFDKKAEDRTILSNIAVKPLALAMGI